MSNRIRPWLRRVLPNSLRERVAQVRRELHDFGTGERTFIADRSCVRADPRGLIEALQVVQPIRRSEHWQGKLQNLRLAAQLLDGTVIDPNVIFSFWAMVGRPTVARGFAVGRGIRAGRLEQDVGGGLCQISGLTYELGLRAGLTLRERYPHSRDLYDETTRFTPLGLDATVVWPYKDLRLQNNLRESIAFAFDVTDETICGRVFAISPIVPAELAIECENATDDRFRVARVRRSLPSGVEELVSNDMYTVSVCDRPVERSDVTVLPC